MRKPINIARYSPGLTLAVLTTVTILSLGHVALAQAQGVTPSWTIATAVPPLHANGKIAFTSDRDGNREIYVMNPDGTNQVRLTNNSMVDDHPTWSPDGTKIAFVGEKSSGGFAIFQMNADGTNKTQITPIRFPIWDAWSMSWSPEGSRIVFQEPKDASGFVNDIFMVNVDGSDRHVLINQPADVRQPSWSPDGSRILFTSQVSFAFHNLFTVKPDGSDLQALSHTDFPYRSSDSAPSWSPDSHMIAFTMFDWANGADIGISNWDGLGRFLFDSGSEDPYQGTRDNPQWSPDGSKIIFQVGISDGDIEIYVKNINGTGLTQLTNTPGSNFEPSWQPLAPAACPNPIDCADFFVRQHYLDFLNREPDPDGLAFWINEITSCGGDLQCIEIKRINVSAAYFLSIEFQQTGYLVYRTYKASYGNLPGTPVPIKFNEFLPDTQQIGQGVVVNQTGWEQLLENNKQTFFSGFVQRARFSSAYPTSLTPDQFVDQLFMNAGVTPSAIERTEAVNEFGAAMTTNDPAARARALRHVTENSTLAQQEFNRAFVLMQYFGYLRRNPNDPPEIGLNFDGYNFWLTKLNQFNGNFADAEMVKAFLVSTEYRQRF